MFVKSGGSRVRLLQTLRPAWFCGGKHDATEVTSYATAIQTEADRMEGSEKCCGQDGVECSACAAVGTSGKCKT
eukprot:3049468-Rhodomonas_salina.1